MPGGEGEAASSAAVGAGTSREVSPNSRACRSAITYRGGQLTVGSDAAAQLGRVLVINDNFDMAESMTWMLEGLAREIKMVHSGTAALEVAPALKPDVIVCDIGMTGMDGYETCRGLRQAPGLEKVVIAAVSGYGNEDDRRRSQEAGFDRHIVKPIGRVTLEELFKSAAAGG